MARVAEQPCAEVGRDNRFGAGRVTQCYQLTLSLHFVGLFSPAGREREDTEVTGGGKIVRRGCSSKRIFRKSQLTGRFFLSPLSGVAELSRRWLMSKITAGEHMLSYTLLFLVIALVAAWLGFGMASGVAALAAKICFVAFLILFIASLVRGRGRTKI